MGHLARTDGRRALVSFRDLCSRFSCTWYDLQSWHGLRPEVKYFIAARAANMASFS